MDGAQYDNPNNGGTRAEADLTTRRDIVTALGRQRILTRWLAAVAVAMLLLNTTLTVLFGRFPTVFGRGVVCVLLVPSLIGFAVIGAPLNHIAKGVSNHLYLIKRHEGWVRALLRQEKRLRNAASLPWALSMMGVMSAGFAINDGDTSWYRYVVAFQIGLLLLGSAAIYLAYRAYAKASEEKDLDRSR